MAKLSSTHIFGNLVVDGNIISDGNIDGNADTASKVNNSIKIRLNGGTTENTNQFTFDGSEAKNVNITPSSIGAATTSTATTSANGLMSSTDKSKLDGIAANANNYSHPTYTSKTSGLYKVTVDNTGHVSATTAVTKADIIGLGIPGSDTTYSVATTSANGLMSSTDKSKLNGIATNANNYSHPTTSGNKHIPSGGSSGQILRWSADGTAVWGNDNNTTYSTGTTSASGLTKLYTGTGTATDGTMTQAALKTALDGKAASSHGNHVPTTQTANNAVFLRNDNTWQTITPANIGAAASSHTHNYAGSSSVGGAANSAVKATQDSAGQQINTTYIKGLSVSGKTITYTKGDGTTGTITTQDTNTTYSTGTASALGLTKLYTGTGTATDGTMTQAAIKTALDGKANSSHGRHIPDACTTITDWNSATTNGWYMGNNATNAPTSGSNIWYFGEVVAHNTNYVIQTVYQFTASTDAKAIPKYIRAKTNGTWGAWTNVTVAKAVPSNAVFTDTNTWRGVQDNLTSTATDQSLSANQGKVLKGLVDGKANSSHTHNSITNQDTRNVNTTPTQMPLGLSVHLKSNSTDGLNDGGTYHSTLMIKGWNDVSGGPWAQMAVTANNNLYFRSSNNDTWNAWKKVSLDGHTHNYASSGHTHNYAGSSSAGGAANSATKLTTARTINGTSFNGSANITTANWGTARNISIADSAGTNTGSAVSVNGSANVTLKLPGTIKATLTGNASTATTLQTTRSINGTNFNGSANITTANWGTARTINGISVNGSTNYILPVENYCCNVGNDNTNLYHKILESGQVTGSWTDKSILLFVTNAYQGGGHGIVKITLRTNDISSAANASGEIRWLVRSGLAVDSIVFNIVNQSKNVYMDVFYKCPGTYCGLTWYVLSEGQRNSNHSKVWTKFNTSSTSGAYTEANMKALRSYTATLQTGSDSGQVASANTLATARTINGTSFNGSANITTANWGTARNIYIADNSSTNTGPAVSVNGSGNATLKLPATIKASLSGNASTATKATQDSAGQQINKTYIKGLSVSGKTITYTKGDGTTGTITTQDTNTTYSTGTTSASGLTKLYTGTGTATDGTMTQAALKTALDGKANSSHTHTTINSNFTVTDQLFKYKGITPSAASLGIIGGGGYDYVQGCNISIGANPDISSGIYGACLIGYDNTTQIGDTFIMGARNESYDTRNFIFGCDNIAEAYDNFIIGQFNTTNSESDCYIFGSGNTVGGNSTAIKIALGSGNTLNCTGVAIGRSNNVDGYDGAAMGCNAKVLDDGGYAIGYFARAHAYQLGIGHFGNVSSGAKSWGTEGTAFVIGNGGGDSSCSNACRITYAGAVIGKAAYASSGADYAEYFEWLDGNPNNEDRVGYFVTMEGDKIKIAKEGDYLLGVVSGYPAVIGNNDMEWQGQFLTDDFGRPIKEKLTKSVHKDPEDENSEIEIKEYEYFALNPNYNPNEKYIHREDRPEWDTVGMLGVLSVYDDGTCKVNGYCKCNNEGIATTCERGFDTYRVIKRVNDRIVKIIFNIK